MTTPTDLIASSNRRRRWMLQIEKNKPVDRVEDSNLWKKHCIYQVPACIKDLNPQAYRPQVVFFGPYHHDYTHVETMEDYKRRALHHLLTRTGRPLSSVVEAMEAVLPDLIGSYERLNEKWTWNNDCEAFLEVMIVDGCLMLELLRFYIGEPANYAASDPIFSDHGMIYMAPSIKRDMLLLENQIPLLVLKTLLSVTSTTAEEADLADIINLVRRFCFQGPLPMDSSKLGESLHLLDMAHKCMVWEPASNSRVAPTETIAGDHIVRTAVQLIEAGIYLRKSSTNSLKDISFHHGVLRLPFFNVDKSTESLLLNLMAYERLHPGTGCEVTSYVFFMNTIIHSSQDVHLLKSKAIISNALGSDKAVAKLFNTLCKGATIRLNHHLLDICQRVNGYCQEPWNMWRANLVHTYFRSPWALISLAAAIFLLILTVVSTVFTVLQFLQQKKSSCKELPSV